MELSVKYSSTMAPETMNPMARSGTPSPLKSFAEGYVRLG